MTRLRRLGKEETVRLAEFAQKPVAAVSGIAKPDRFNADLQKADLRIVLRRDFEDHHRYSLEEFASIVRAAQSAKAEAIIVTEKDAANLSGEMILQSPLPIYAAQIEFRCEQEAVLKELLFDTATRNRES
jgi:tetraacyldisaccharide 4'-kinase